jgi:hypothetical protein
VIDNSRFGLAVRTPVVFRGVVSESLRRRGYHVHSVDTLRLDIGDRFILDGEAFPAGATRFRSVPSCASWCREQRPRRALGAALDRPLDPAVADFARELGEAAGARAVLFYGSNLRTGSLEGVLDFYVLLPGARETGCGRAFRIARSRTAKSCCARRSRR